jgi:uncharacterized protein (TIGR02246 family)
MTISVLVALPLACGSPRTQAQARTDSDPAAAAAVRQLVAELTLAVSRGDAAAIAAMLAEDVVIVGEGGEVVRGRDHARAALQLRLVTPHHVQVDSEISLETSRDLAYRLGTHTLTIVHSDRILVPDTTTEVRTSYDLTVFGARPDGSWKIEALMVTRDPTAIRPPPH